MLRLISRLSLSSLLACTGGDVCASRSVEACEDLPACTLVQGTPLSFLDEGDTAALSCYELGDPEPLACAPRSQSCTPDLKLGKSPEGTCYEFGNCVPEGFGDCPEAEGAEACF
jgi:hypothetical protein